MCSYQQQSKWIFLLGTENLYEDHGSKEMGKASNYILKVFYLKNNKLR
jgi:hypothetical protein